MDAQELFVFVRTGCMQHACKAVLRRRGLFLDGPLHQSAEPLEERERAALETRAAELGFC